MIGHLMYKRYSFTVKDAEDQSSVYSVILSIFFTLCSP